MPTMLDEDSLKPYTMLRDVITDVMQPTNDGVRALNLKVDALNARLDEKYYTKDMIDQILKRYDEQLQELRERWTKTLTAAGGVLMIFTWLMQHFHV